MSRRKRFKIRQRQRLRRRKRLRKLRRKSLNIESYFYGGHYVGLRAEK